MSCTFQSWVLFSNSYTLRVDFLTPLMVGEDLKFIYPWHCIDHFFLIKKYFLFT